MKEGDIMNFIKKYKYLITTILLVIIALILSYLKYNLNNKEYDIIEEPEKIVSTEKLPEEKEEKECMVDIKGAVKNPKVYKVTCTSNVQDVINLAGGLLDNADTSIINLAKKITDEMVIIIYTKEEVKNSNIIKTVVKEIDKECVCPNIQNDGCINDKITDEIKENPNSLININKASLEELLTIPKIGESKAKAIIKYREENGNYKTIEDIKNVSGIGEKLYEEIKIYITT